MIELYPMTFQPIYKEMVWGGTKMRRLGRSIPYPNTGESWDVSCREKEKSIISNGSLEGRTLCQAIEADREGMLGIGLKDTPDFPLLVKIIDANDFLSVQVHPDDSYAKAAENYPYGKNEMWYILDAPPESYLIIGLKDGTAKPDFEEAIKNGTVEECLNKLYVKPGDIVDIPAGLIHAIGKGILLAEIQQNSDITYRVYDYNRRGLDGKPRALHVDKSLDVIDFTDSLSKLPVNTSIISQTQGGTTEACISNDYFTIQLYTLKGSIKEESDRERFHIFTCVENNGGCRIITPTYKAEIDLGASVFIPAGMGSYEIQGDCKLLKSFSN